MHLILNYFNSEMYNIYLILLARDSDIVQLHLGHLGEW